MQTVYGQQTAVTQFLPGHLTDTSVTLQNAQQAPTSLGFTFNLDKLPSKDTYYFWAYTFYFASGNVGYIGFQNNGNLLTQSNVGGVVNFAIWNAKSATAGSNGEAGVFGNEGVGYRTPIKYDFTSNQDYAVSIVQHGDYFTATVSDGTATKTVGTIQAPAGEKLTSSVITFNEVYLPTANVEPATATFSNFTANGSVKQVSANPYYHNPLVTAAHVDYVTVLQDNKLSQLTGGTGNNKITLSNADSTTWLGACTETLVCGTGSDTVYVGTGNATISGGSGQDSLRLTKTYASYTVTTADTVTLTDKTTGQLVSASGFEALYFSDKSVTLPSAQRLPTKASEVQTTISEPLAPTKNYFLLTVADHSTDILVRYNTVDQRVPELGKAFAGQDYVALSGVTTLAAGTNVFAIGVDVLSNVFLSEPQETLSMHVQVTVAAQTIDLVAIHTILAHQAL